VVVVAVTHDQLAQIAEQALALPARTSWSRSRPASAPPQIDRLIEAAARRPLVKVGFNHRFHPGSRELAAEVHSGVTAS
jgi:hypothetical protein